VVKGVEDGGGRLCWDFEKRGRRGEEKRLFGHTPKWFRWTVRRRRGKMMIPFSALRRYHHEPATTGLFIPYLMNSTDDGPTNSLIIQRVSTGESQ